MKTKISDNITVEDTGSNIIISYKDVTIPVCYGKEFDNLTYLLVYLNNNKSYGLPNLENDIEGLGIEGD